ncbi:hypothetical protein [Hymenobacter lapidiphilus]|uniref:hypothetical protein n=1 Tax=Hymenobacter sp. CCM 8763 TaxID=2303334 RepID=UPI0011C1A2A2|nr:hypothetical protein [Hymenobacter sp. CCM 8763]
MNSDKELRKAIIFYSELIGALRWDLINRQQDYLLEHLAQPAPERTAADQAMLDQIAVLLQIILDAEPGLAEFGLDGSMCDAVLEESIDSHQQVALEMTAGLLRCCNESDAKELLVVRESMAAWEEGALVELMIEGGRLIGQPRRDVVDEFSGLLRGAKPTNANDND